MRTAAIIAIIFAVMGALLGLAQLATYQYGLGNNELNQVVSRVKWPINTVVHSVPVIALAIGLLIHSREHRLEAMRARLGE